MTMTISMSISIILISYSANVLVALLSNCVIPEQVLRLPSKIKPFLQVHLKLPMTL